MINSRRLEDLHPFVKALAEQFIDDCKAANIDILVTSTYRDNESQQALYNQGRSSASKAAGEKIVTNARPGQSYHNWRVAFDVVPLVAGKAIWNDDKLWQRIGEIGIAAGLEWAGTWKSFKEMPHFQLTGGLTIDDFTAGKKLEDVIELGHE